MRNPTTAAIYIARGLRDFGDGFIAVLLPVYLSALGLNALQIGIVATVSLLGSALTTLVTGQISSKFGNRINPRQLLMIAAAIMAATGTAFALSQHYWLILLVAFAGTINPSSGSVSIFVPIEHTLLSGQTADRDRTRMFARYSLIGSMSAAVGALAAGGTDWLGAYGVSRITALKAMFVLYALLGVAGGIAYSRIPAAAAVASAAPGTQQQGLGPSRTIVYKLAALFSIDSFAGGFAVQSLMALWLFSKFGMSIAAAGVFFFCTSLLAAFSFPVATWLASRIGLVNTMVYTHIPSSLCLMLAAVSPRLDVALGLLLVRAALSQMDVPTRTSYVMAVVSPPERPAAASITSVPRSLAAALSPALAGAMFQAGHEALPFLICGALKIAYDIALLWTFRHVKPPEEQGR